MRRQSRSIVHVALLAIALGAAASLNPGAAAQTPQSADPMTALLAEVHALRLAMEQSAILGPRIQLTMARLTLQEQRVTHVSAELDTVRLQLGSVALQSKQVTDELAATEQRLQTEVDLARRTALENQSRALKMQLAVQSATEQQLRGHENEAAQALATEQARWAELNARLDELDRSLGPVR
jgi:hypothetical protein